VPHARYLGARYKYNGSNDVEIRFRLAAITKAWHEMGEYWTSDTSRKLKRETFLTKVMGAAVSGLEASVLLPSEEQQLDAKVAGYLRVLSQGAGCEIRPSSGTTGYFKKKTNATIRKTWRVLPIAVELGVRIFKWLQDMTRFPAAHSQTIAALFGDLPGDEEKTLNDAGQLHALANPWAKMFEEKIRYYEHVSGTETFFEVWNDTGQSWTALFCDPDVREEFQRVDPKVLRAAFWNDTTTWTRFEQKEKHAHPCPEAREEWVCQLLNEQGLVCGRVFKTVKLLQVHQTKTKPVGLSTHGVRHPLRSLVINNQCPVCRQTFPNTDQARRHIVRSYSSGLCLTGQTHFAYDVQEVENFDCSWACGFKADNLSDLLSHHTTHLPAPLPNITDVARSRQKGRGRGRRGDEQGAGESTQEAAQCAGSSGGDGQQEGQAGRQRQAGGREGQGEAEEGAEGPNRVSPQGGRFSQRPAQNVGHHDETSTSQCSVRPRDELYHHGDHDHRHRGARVQSDQGPAGDVLEARLDEAERRAASHISVRRTVGCSTSTRTSSGKEECRRDQRVQRGVQEDDDQGEGGHHSSLLGRANVAERQETTLIGRSSRHSDDGARGLGSTRRRTKTGKGTEHMARARAPDLSGGTGGLSETELTRCREWLRSRNVPEHRWQEMLESTTVRNMALRDDRT